MNLLEDKLAALLQRVQRRLDSAKQAELKRRLKKKYKDRRAAINFETAQVAIDYAQRLAERAKFRRLLSDDRLDGERFRFYVEHFADSDLDTFRGWIDSKMNAPRSEKVRA